MKKKILAAVTAAMLAAGALVGCTEASQVSHNVSQEADYWSE